MVSTNRQGRVDPHIVEKLPEEERALLVDTLLRIYAPGLQYVTAAIPSEDFDPGSEDPPTALRCLEAPRLGSTVMRPRDKILQITRLRISASEYWLLLTVKGKWLLWSSGSFYDLSFVSEAEYLLAREERAHRPGAALYFWDPYLTAVVLHRLTYLHEKSISRREEILLSAKGVQDLAWRVLKDKKVLIS